MPSVTFTTRGALQKSALRQANERLILNAIRENPAISRSDLARLTGLSPSSISFIVNRLKRQKVVIEDAVANHSQIGRRPTALRLAQDAKMAIAVEVASSGSRVALVDLAGGIVRERRVPWQPNHEILTHRIHSTIRSFLGRLGPNQALGIGVALPGTIDTGSGRIIAAENFNWFNLEFGKLLKGRLTLPFYFENNAKVAALAERWFTKPGQRAPRDFVFVVPDGGLGTGIVTNGHLLQGASGMAGEFGHIVLYPDGLKCPCGNRGCLEQYTSDQALCRRYMEETRTDGELPPDAYCIVRLAREDHPAAIRVLQRTARDLALGFVNLIWVFNPGALVVGGFVAEGWDMLEETIWQVLRSRVPHYILGGLRIYPSRHASDTFLLGAASLVFSRFFTSFHSEGDESPTRRVLIHTAE